MNDLIYALATPVGGAIAVVRLSGAGADALLHAIFTGRGGPREMVYGRVVDEAGETLDQAMAAFFPAPRSYTGEDMAELYLHGGQASVRRVLALLGRHARSARPGEFTERAFLAGKLDLAQAEAVMDLINAGAERGAKSALSQLEGGLSRRIAAVEGQLLDALSGLEAAIDYPEELEEDVTSALPHALASAEAELRALIGAGLSGRVLREGARVALLGRPNAGKSSLLNALSGVERAIVTQYAGTTRDVLEETVSMEACGNCGAAADRRMQQKRSPCPLEAGCARGFWAPCYDRERADRRRARGAAPGYRSFRGARGGECACDQRPAYRGAAARGRVRGAGARNGRWRGA